jgi:DnaJ-class molecular chaperone
MAGERERSNTARSGPKLNPGDEARPGTTGAGENLCPDCGGSGKIGARDCPTCGGTGKVIEGIGGG